jgi:hypothetical protein
VERRQLCAGAELRCLCVLIVTGLGFALWTASAGAQVYPATETLQLSSTGEAPDDGLLHVGPTTLADLEGPRYRVLFRFDLPAIDPDRLLSASLVLRDVACYLGEAPPVIAHPILSDWGAETAWDAQPEAGGAAGSDAWGDCPETEARIDVTALVREWSTGTAPNLGIELRGDESIVEPTTYETSEGPSGLLDRRFDSEASASLVVALLPESPVLPVPPGAALPPVLLTGVLVDEHGTPIRGGDVFLYPSLDTEGAVESSQLASAEADASGVFVLRLSGREPGVAAAAAANDGWVNFDAAFVDGNRVQFRSFSRRLDRGAWVSGEGQVRVQFDSPAAIASQAPGVRTALSQSDPSHARPVCYVATTKLGEADKYVVIGEAHVWKDQSMTWTYGERADSDIGVGYSTDGLHWSVSGTVHVSNRRGAEISDTISNLRNGQGNFGRKYRSEFHFVKYRQRRTCLGRSTTVYRIKATQWNGGFDYYDDVKDLNGHCGDIYKENAIYFTPAAGNGTFARTSENLRTYTGAVTVFGVMLSGQTGASKSASQSWRFGGQFPRYYLCGDTGKPTESERIFAGF